MKLNIKNLKGKIMSAATLAMVALLSIYMSKNGFVNEDIIVVFIGLVMAALYGMLGIKMDDKVKSCSPVAEQIYKIFCAADDKECTCEKADKAEKAVKEEEDKENDVDEC